MTEFIILFPFTFAFISKKTVFFKDPTEVIPSTLLVFFTFLSGLNKKLCNGKILKNEKGELI